MWYSSHHENNGLYNYMYGVSDQQMRVLLCVYVWVHFYVVESVSLCVSGEGERACIRVLKYFKSI